VVASLTAIWAWYTDVSLLGSEREHVLPDMLLMACGLPTSLLLEPIYIRWPQHFSGLAQTALLTTCAFGQWGLFASLAFRESRSART
jgi:hypothetical protein